jgi:hypothetical protein
VRIWRACCAHKSSISNLKLRLQVSNKPKAHFL